MCSPSPRPVGSLLLLSRLNKAWQQDRPNARPSLVRIPLGAHDGVIHELTIPPKAEGSNRQLTATRLIR
jgi:hypothetical protein